MNLTLMILHDEVWFIPSHFFRFPDLLWRDFHNFATPFVVVYGSTMGIFVAFQGKNSYQLGGNGYELACLNTQLIFLAAYNSC